MHALKGQIDACLTDPAYADGRKMVREEAWAHFGEGAQRTVDYLLQKYEALRPEQEE